MSSRCCVDPGAKQTHEVKGAEELLGGVNTYKTGAGQSAIVIFTDIFGYSFINVRKIADYFADQTSKTVLIPDYFNGDPMDPNAPNLWDLLPAWLQKHPPSDAVTIAERFISAIKSNYDTIQIIGFCYGAKIVVHFITNHELSPTVKNAIVGHPSFLVKEEAKLIERPILFLCAENDSLFTDELRQEFETQLKSNGLGKFLQYPGTTHGFVVRPDDATNVIEQRDKALRDAAEFFNQ